MRALDTFLISYKKVHFTLNTTPATQSASAYIEKTTRLSRYVRNLLISAPALRDDLQRNLAHAWTKPEMEAFLSACPIADEKSLKKTLRDLRKAVMLRLLTRDLNGLADLQEVMDTMTAIAEVTTNCAILHLSHWLKSQYGDPIGAESGELQTLIVVGMGKLGGGELNVSSDIDLIFIYQEEGETTGPRKLSNHEYFTQLGRKLNNAISEITEDGYVFRVDMRLRPYGDSGALVVSFAMLENYFITQGREWERYAWIKARAISGDHIEDLTQLARPFIFRKYLDFGAFASMRDLHAQIRREVQRRELSNNIKLGPGGIREIEFTAQVFQLIRGGKVTELQILPTLKVLQLLENRDLLSTQAVTELSEAYVFLRNLEHRLQYLDDAQTQTLPENPTDQAIIAEGMEFADYDRFLQVLNSHRNKVSRHFDQVFAAPQSTQESHPLAALWSGLENGESTSRLAELGYTNPESIHNRLHQLKHSSRYNQMPDTNRTRFDALIPPLIEVSSGFPNPDQTLERILVLLESVSRRESYLALLLEYPQSLNQVAKICSASPWAADYLARQPILLDELLDTRLLYQAPEWGNLKIALQKQMDEQAGDVERQMDILRQFKHAQVFHFLAQDLAGLLPLEQLSDNLSDLADLILSETLRACWKNLTRRHCEIPQFAIIAYGRLGGKELGYASDLDIIFLYDDESQEAPEIYARLAQRMNTWLSSITSAGMLYETDLRLRPDGASGLLVSSVVAFETYQKSKAWVWEHQALTRARWVAGDNNVGKIFDRIRCEVLKQTRDQSKLAQDIIEMRQKMRDSHPNTSGLFDIKHDRGGIVDVEFIVQYLVLANASRHAELTRNIGNLALLKLSGELNLIPADLAESARDAYRQYRQWQHQLRLQGAKYARLEQEKAAEYCTSVQKLWNTVFGG